MTDSRHSLEYTKVAVTWWILFILYLWWMEKEHQVGLPFIPECLKQSDWSSMKWKVGIIFLVIVSTFRVLPFLPQQNCIVYHKSMRFAREPSIRSETTLNTKILEISKRKTNDILTYTQRHTLCFTSLLPSGSILQKHPKTQDPCIDSFGHLFSIFLYFLFCIKIFWFETQIY
jgi:hypothetical protein